VDKKAAASSESLDFVIMWHLCQGLGGMNRHQAKAGKPGGDAKARQRMFKRHCRCVKVYESLHAASNPVA
jgi:hypothetical protein